MTFLDPDGLREVLWVERVHDDAFLVLNVPVFVFGVSLGTVVQGMNATRRAADKQPVELRVRRVLRASVGGTVRVIVPAGMLASHWYTAHFLPHVRQRGRLRVGPATFFDPRMVAIHVKQRHQVWGALAGYMSDALDRGVIQQWTAADPEEGQRRPAVDRALRGDDLGARAADEGILIHPAPEMSGRKYMATARPRPRSEIRRGRRRAG